MGTTGGKAVLDVLDALSDSGIRWALLHGAEALDGDALSDLDVATDLITPAQVDAFDAELALRGLRPFVSSPYDITGVGLFVVSEDLTAGVQLDLLMDPAGAGMYGLRTGSALVEARTIGHLSVLSEVDAWLYRVRKRQLKADAERLRVLLNARPANDAALRRRANELFTGQHADIVIALLDGETSPASPSHTLKQLARLMWRLRHPAGLWVHIKGPYAPEICLDVQRRVEPIVLSTAVVAISPWNMLVRSTGIGPAPSVRWRGGVVLSSGSTARRPTMSLDNSDGGEEVVTRITRLAGARAVDEFKRWLARTTH